MDILTWLSDLHPHCKAIVQLLLTSHAGLLMAIGVLWVALWGMARRTAARQADMIRAQEMTIDRLLSRFDSSRF